MECTIQRSCTKCTREFSTTTYALAHINKRYRDKNRKDIRYQAGDKVLIWETSHTGPKKLSFRWSLPHTIIRPSSRNPLLYIVQDNQGKTKLYHVNRLHLYNPFNDSANPHCSHEHILRPSSPIIEFKNLKKSDYVIVQYRIREKIDKLPFALAQIISTNPHDSTVNVWWMGNNNENIFAAQRYGYWQPSTNKIYYQVKPLHKSHPKYTSYTTNSVINTTTIIAHGFDLGIEDNIPFSVLLQISENDDVPWKINTKIEGLDDITRNLR